MDNIKNASSSRTVGSKVKVGLIGSGFIADIHAHSFHHHVRDAEVVAVASPTPGKAAEFAAKRGIPHAFQDYREMLKMEDLDLVTLGIPNDLHCQVVLDAASAGKHIVCEKPLCRTMNEADRMIEACKEAGVHLLYAEELVYAPKYVRAKQLVDEGALGRALPGEAVGRALRPARALVLGCEPFGRRRHAGYGLS